MRTTHELLAPAANNQTIVVETSQISIETFDIFRATPFEFNETALSLHQTVTVGRVFTVPLGSRVEPAGKAIAFSASSREAAAESLEKL